MLTAGVQLPYIAHQLGHSSISTTERCYARWVPQDEYRPPVALEPGEVPADLLVRLSSHPDSHTGDPAAHAIGSARPGREARVIIRASSSPPFL